MRRVDGVSSAHDCAELRGKGCVRLDQRWKKKKGGSLSTTALSYF
jgi:hypothetical protein